MLHAQQAAEKALKGVLAHFGEEPAHTHDIHLLILGVSAYVAVPTEVKEAASLTDYAVTSRCPADLGEIDHAEWQEAVALARAVVEWAERLIDGE